MLNLFGDEVPTVTPTQTNRDNWFRGTKHGNPCIKMFGKGPEQTTCKTCKHLTRVHWDKAYIKCTVRGTDGKSSSDHLAKWPSCARYEEQDPLPLKTTKKKQS